MFPVGGRKAPVNPPNQFTPASNYGASRRLIVPRHDIARNDPLGYPTVLSPTIQRSDLLAVRRAGVDPMRLDAQSADGPPETGRHAAPAPGSPASDGQTLIHNRGAIPAEIVSGMGARTGRPRMAAADTAWTTPRRPPEPPSWHPMDGGAPEKGVSLVVWIASIFAALIIGLMVGMVLYWEFVPH